MLRTTRRDTGTGALAALALSLVTGAGPADAGGPQGRNWFGQDDRGKGTLWAEGRGEEIAEITRVAGHDGEKGSAWQFAFRQANAYCVMTNRTNPTVLKSEPRVRRFVLHYWLKTETNYRTGDNSSCWIRMQTPSFIGADVSYPRSRFRYCDEWTHVGQLFELGRDGLIGSLQFRLRATKPGLKVWIDEPFFTEVTDLPEAEVKKMLQGVTFVPQATLPFREELVDTRPPVKGNRLRNTGFEFVADGALAVAAHRMTEEDFTAASPHSGRRAFRLRDRKLLHGPIELNLYKKHTLSAWVRPEDPAKPARVEMRLQSFEKAYRYGRQLRRLEPGWQRVTLTKVLMPVPSRLYWVLIQGKNLVVDDVQLEEGDPTPYAPAAGLEAALTMDARAYVYAWGDRPAIALHLANPADEPADGTLTLQVRDAFENLVHEADVPAKLAAGERATHVVHCPVGLRGAFRADLKKGDTVLDRQVFSLLPPPRDIPAEQSMMGDHLNFNEFNLWAGRRMGTRWTRCHDGWTKVFKMYLVHPKPDVWTWNEPLGESAGPDDAVKLARTHGIKILGLLDEPPGWAAGVPQKPRCRWEFPTDWDAWGAYVRKTVGRYRAYIDAWELYNEPSHTEKYLELAGKTRQALDEAAPDARLIGLSNSPYTPMVEAFAKLGGDKLLDGVTTHIYAWSPKGNLGANFRRIAAIYRKDGRPMDHWMTEGNFRASHGMFYPGHPRYDAERKDVQNLPRYLTVARAHDLKRVFYYWSNFPAPSPQSPVTANGWSFYHHDTSFTPGAAAWAVWGKMLDGAEPLATLVDRDEEAYLFRDGDEIVLACWAETPRTVTLPAGAFEDATACRRFDAMGNETPVDLSRPTGLKLDHFITYFRFRKAAPARVSAWVREGLGLPDDWKVRKGGELIREEDAFK